MTKHIVAILVLVFLVTCLASVAWSQTPDPINGTVTLVGSVACQPYGIGNSTCYSLNVACSGIDVSGIPAIAVTLKVTNPGSTKGTILFTDAGGSDTFFEGQFAYGSLIMNALARTGFTIVQIEYAGTSGYLAGPAPDGARALSCRYAAVANWVFANTASSPLIHPASAAMCAAGLSGGSSSIGYALSHFGMGTGSTRIFDMVELISGPTFSTLDHGCICDEPPLAGIPAQPTLSVCYLTATGLIDGTYPGTYCASASRNHSTNNLTLLKHDSLLSDDPPFLSYTTNVHVLYGGQDQSAGPAQGLAWVRAVTSPVSVNTVLDAGHFLPDSFAGAVQVVNDLSNACKKIP